MPLWCQQPRPFDNSFTSWSSVAEKSPIPISSLLMFSLACDPYANPYAGNNSVRGYLYGRQQSVRGPHNALKAIAVFVFGYLLIVRTTDYCFSNQRISIISSFTFYVRITGAAVEHRRSERMTSTHHFDGECSLNNDSKRRYSFLQTRTKNEISKS